MSDKAAISRANGSMSNGPKTSEGKARSSQNAIRHGLTSRAIVLAHESREDFEDLEASYFEVYRPVGPVESDLVREMVAARWRSRRGNEMESALFLKTIKARTEETEDAEEARVLAYADMAESKALQAIYRHAAQLRRAYEKALKELQVLQAERAQRDSSIDDFEKDDFEKLQNEPSDMETEAFVETFLRPPAEYRGYIDEHLASFREQTGSLAA